MAGLREGGLRMGDAAETGSDTQAEALTSGGTWWDVLNIGGTKGRQSCPVGAGEGNNEGRLVSLALSEKNV